MNIHYKFDHACGHTGDGPKKHSNSSEARSTNPLPTRTLRISLRFSCPFCCNHRLAVKGCEGIVVILTPPSAPTPNTWHIIRGCAYEDVKPEEWSLAHVAGGHVAWIPEPCGQVDITGGEEISRRGRMEDGNTTYVSCSWKQRRGEPFRSRFAGLLSQMDAALSSGGQAGRQLAGIGR